MNFTVYDPDNPHRYDEMIDLSPPGSKVHTPMSLGDRAAQFASFRALSGYEDMVAEVARLTDREWDLSEDVKELLDRQLSMINHQIEAGEKPEVTVIYFIPDEYKKGGRYQSMTGKVKAVDDINRQMIFYAENEYSNGKRIDIDGIYGIEM